MFIKCHFLNIIYLNKVCNITQKKIVNIHFRSSFLECTFKILLGLWKSLNIAILTEFLLCFVLILFVCFVFGGFFLGGGWVLVFFFWGGGSWKMRLCFEETVCFVCTKLLHSTWRQLIQKIQLKRPSFSSNQNLSGEDSTFGNPLLENPRLQFVHFLV